MHLHNVDGVDAKLRQPGVGSLAICQASGPVTLFIEKCYGLYLEPRKTENGSQTVSFGEPVLFGVLVCREFG